MQGGAADSSAAPPFFSAAELSNCRAVSRSARAPVEFAQLIVHEPTMFPHILNSCSRRSARVLCLGIHVHYTSESIKSPQWITIMADQLTKEGRSTGRRTITIKEATRAFRTALGDTEKPELIEAPADTTLIQHPRGGYVITPSGKTAAKSSATRSSGSAAPSRTSIRSTSAGGGTKPASTAGKPLSGRISTGAGKTNDAGAKKQPATKLTGPPRSRE